MTAAMTLCLKGQKFFPYGGDEQCLLPNRNHVTHGTVQPSQPQPRGPSGAYMSHFLGPLLPTQTKFIILECWELLLFHQLLAALFFTANKASDPQPAFICQAQNDEKKSFQKIAKSLVLLP